MSVADDLEVLYEDNHLVVINKHASEIVQGDKTGDEPLVERVREYIRAKYEKPGNVFCGLVHRLDRPTSGVLIFTRTSKALERMNKLFANAHPEKTYWAIVENAPQKPSGRLVDLLVKNEKQNKSYTVEQPRPGAKEARLSYETLAKSDRYTLLGIKLETGRHHQIRAQLANIGCIIKGDVKYGAKRSNPDGSICLHARSITFEHPVKKENITIVAPVPNDPLWQFFGNEVKNEITG